MRFLADEHVFRQLVEGLRSEGHDVVWARTDYPGFDDEALLSLATDDKRLVISEDRDFGTLTVLHRRPTIGILIVCISDFRLPLEQVADSIIQTVAKLGDDMKGNITIIEPARVRQRRLADDQTST